MNCIEAVKKNATRIGKTEGRILKRVAGEGGGEVR